MIVQGFSTNRLLWQFVIPVSVFAYCYGRIFHTLRRQSKVISGHHGPTATTSRDQIQQQATGAGVAAPAGTAAPKLSRTELNVLKTKERKKKRKKEKKKE